MRRSKSEETLCIDMNSFTLSIGDSQFNFVNFQIHCFRKLVSSPAVRLKYQQLIINSFVEVNKKLTSLQFCLLLLFVIIMKFDSKSELIF